MGRGKSKAAKHEPRTAEPARPFQPAQPAFEPARGVETHTPYGGRDSVVVRVGLQWDLANRTYIRIGPYNQRRVLNRGQHAVIARLCGHVVAWPHIVGGTCVLYTIFRLATNVVDKPAL